ncbi:aldo/keto reductase [Mycolicibacterium goodii]|uniref:Oxidoreductase n=1 Tax=Mycolicibacterium goodii TaxID=134601 RepID=A0A0K0XDK0_MYCGD|nr:oxidoreductase [Mycolicibacterium goodii]
MRYRTLGRHTGLRVSEYALGTARFGAPEHTDDARAVFGAFVDQGGTTFATSNIYQDGRAEALLGELMGRDRDDYVVVTKYSGAYPGAGAPRPGTTGNSRKTMIRSLEASLRRLGTDYVDVFMPHFPDQITPVEEIMAGFEDLVRSGKIRYGGFSNFPAWRIAGAAVRADLLGMPRPICIETEYSLAERTADRELLPMAEAHGLGVLLYSPLAGGLLTGKYRRGETGRLSAAGRAIEKDLQQTAVIDEVLAIARETEHTAAGVSLEWLRHRAALASTALIPILGPRIVEHLTEYLQPVDLDIRHHQRLDKASAPRMGAPHDDVAGALLNGYDGDRSLLDAPRVPPI